MSDYQLTPTTAIVRKSDGAAIPADPANRDYADFLAWQTNGGVADPYVPPPAPPEQVLSQELMAQFTTDDATKIQAAVSGNISFWLLWSAMQAQSEPMIVTNARFLAGWNALTQVLGAPRMAAIATGLGVTVS